jgi:hypothetical protein
MVVLNRRLEIVYYDTYDADCNHCHKIMFFPYAWLNRVAKLVSFQKVCQTIFSMVLQKNNYLLGD